MSVWEFGRGACPGPVSDNRYGRARERGSRVAETGPRSSNLSRSPSAPAEFSQVAVKKPHVAVPGVVEYLGVEIVRDRGDHYV